MLLFTLCHSLAFFLYNIFVVLSHTLLTVALKSAAIDFFPFLRRAWFSNQGPLPNRSINIDYKILRL